ncbi:MAG: GNAT family N-acetyltransferase, partial [Burkholderiales bacterium]
AFHIPVVSVTNALSADEACAIATRLGFPVAMKIDSPDITHKSDVGGVRLGLRSMGEVRDAYAAMLANVSRVSPQARVNGVNIESMIEKPNGRELLVGVLRDPVFGPAISFGMGGIAVEVFRDRSIDLPPLNANLARKMIQRTRVARMLGEFRHMPPVDMDALVGVLLRVSEMVCELPQIEEIDINPLIADVHGVVALDARVVLRAGALPGKPYSHLAIHPYPIALLRQIQLADGTSLTVRPIRPEDARMEFEFVSGLSEASRYYRFMSSLRELSPTMLARFTQIDYDRDMALVVVLGEAAAARQIGVARYAGNPDGRSCEFAIVLADAWQGKGLGRKLLGLLIEAARGRGLMTMEGLVLHDNRGMLALCEKLGFATVENPGDSGVCKVVLKL